MKALVDPRPSLGREKNSHDAAKAGCRVVCADRGEQHASREADDLGHVSHAAQQRGRFA